MSMRPNYCQHESQILEGARSGQWGAELRTHAEGCEMCSEAMLVVQALRVEMQTMAASAVPSAGQIWWRAQIRGRRADAERAVQPVRLVQAIAAVCGIGGVIFLLLRYALPLQQWLLHLPASTPGWGEPLIWVFLGTAAMFLGAVSAGLGYMRHS